MSNFFSSSALRFSRAALPIAAVGGLLHRGFTEANGAETIEFPVPQQLDSPGFGTSPDTITGSPAATPAERQFYTASSFPIPKEWTGAAFEIHKEYPKGLRPEAEAPWLETDFKREPERYAAAVKDYCWEGNKEVDWVVQNNRIRKWWHAPWLHHSPNGREPLRGLTFERPTPPFEFAKGQTDALQNWAVGFYNEAGASLFGQVWRDPNRPDWQTSLSFPLGTVGFKLMMSTATDEQVPTMKGSPGFEAVIAQQLDPTVAPKDGGIRNNSSSLVRLLQVDFGVRDNRSITGWVWGTFMYDGGVDKSDPWDRLRLIGIQWGNDPDLSQAAYEKGERPKETWLSPKAEKIRIALGGTRPSWGGNGRLNGPADNFISSCASCHSTAQRPATPAVPPKAKYNIQSKRWAVIEDTSRMKWFRNIVPSTTFELPGISADNSQQLRMGYENFQEWIARQLVNGEQASPDEPKGKEEVN